MAASSPQQKLTPERGLFGTSVDEDLERFQTDPDVKQALARGLRLSDYARQIDADLASAEAVSAADITAQISLVATLHSQTLVCDQALARMQEILLGCREDLRSSSRAISHLQNSLTEMRGGLRNRRAAEALLHDEIDRLCLSENLVIGIGEEDVTPRFAECLEELGAKLRACDGTGTTLGSLAANSGDEGENKSKGHATASVCHALAHQSLCSLDQQARQKREHPQQRRFIGVAEDEVKPHLETLRVKAVVKARRFLLAQFRALTRKKTNVVVLQSHLMRYHVLMSFLHQHAPPVAAECVNAYALMMGSSIRSTFAQYIAQLGKLEREVVSARDLIVADDMNGGFVEWFNGGTSAAAGVTAVSNLEPFMLESRAQILDSLRDPPIILHLAQAQRSTYPYEELFRSFLRHLSDSATSEWVFAKDFFHIQPHELCNKLFADAISACLESLENYLFACRDPFAILLMIRMTEAERSMSQRLGVSSLDGWFDRVILALWPRFKDIFNANVQSLRQKPRAITEGARSGVTAVIGVTRRFAEFSASVLFLTRGASETEMLKHDIDRLVKAMVEMWSNISSAARAWSETERIAFWINQCEHVLECWANRGIRQTTKELGQIEETLEAKREAYVEEALRSDDECFRELVEFVKMCDAQRLRNSACDAQQLEHMLRKFQAGWRTSIERLNQVIASHFTDPMSVEMLKQVLAQLLLYYTRMQDLVRKGWPGERERLSSIFVSTPIILQEIRKYSSTT